jgi:electron transfer flavoprotein alpha/beta subunit
MGPASAEDSLRKALTFGADRAVLLTDRRFAGADTLATTYALATAIRKVGATYGEADIVFTGKQTIDGGQPPAEALIAEIFRRQPKLEAELVAQARGF